MHAVITHYLIILWLDSFFTGGLFIYTTLTVSMLWLFHTATLLWGVVWPIHYNIIKTSDRIKYVHITVVSICFLLPLVSVIGIGSSGGYSISVLLYQRCDATNPTEFFYGMALPKNLIIIIGVSLLLITVWRIADIVSETGIIILYIYITHPNNLYSQTSIIENSY